MKYLPGQSGNPDGRPRGALSRYSRLRLAVLGTFQKLGGEEWLIKVAQDDPRTFLALLGRVLPKLDTEWDSTAAFWADDDDDEQDAGPPVDE